MGTCREPSWRNRSAQRVGWDFRKPQWCTESLTLVPRIVDKWVNFNFVMGSGLVGKLQDAGYCVAWSTDRNLAQRVELEGWEVVIEPDEQGILTRYRVKRPGGR
jgi:hypothetical protein